VKVLSIVIVLSLAGCWLGEKFQQQPATQDLAAPTTGDDLAPPSTPDMAAPVVPDMTITCTQLGQDCTVGVGACARTGKVVCTSQGTASCDATPGAADNSGTWHQAAATNGSWDWDCDGHVQYQYPTGDTTAPPRDNDPSVVSCSAYGIKSACEAPHWFYSYWNHWPDSCGHPVDDRICYWNGSCIDSGGNEVTQGCH
jgi:hypothetical protein